MARSRLSTVKTAVLPRGKRCRRLPLGIARGLRLEIDFSTQTKMYLGLYEVELNRHLRRLCRPGFNCFDLGAQFGYDALLLAKLSGGRVASFECDAVVFEDLTRNVKSNAGLSDRIELCRAFVGAETDHASGVVALDDLVFAGEMFRPEFIKMDIEGGELDALRGASRILQELHPNLLVETHSAELERECIGLVESFGYEVSVINARRLLPDYRPAEHNRWFAAAA